MMEPRQQEKCHVNGTWGRVLLALVKNICKARYIGVIPASLEREAEGSRVSGQSRQLGEILSQKEYLQ